MTSHLSHLLCLLSEAVLHSVWGYVLPLCRDAAENIYPSVQHLAQTHVSERDRERDIERKQRKTERETEKERQRECIR